MPATRKRVPALLLLIVALTAPATIGAGAREAGGAEAAASHPLPILVTGMVHLDPFATPDSGRAIDTYGDHRDGVLWYLDLADSTGLALSMQTTGVYAEACIRQGHWTDFAPAMPGGIHHFGTHVHPKVKDPAPYIWHELSAPDRTNPDSVRVAVGDNIPWVNRIFVKNGFPAAANDFFHGASAYYDGMEADLWCSPTPPVSYPNCFTMGDGERGQLWVYRGPWGTEPFDDPDTSYVKLPEVGGVIGFDQIHGPEGMVYGTLPYQKRDFFRAYLEWREAVRRGEDSAVRHFTWMVHPYQLGATTTGTDGALVRDTIAGLVDWLNARWIGRTDDTGEVMAVYAHAGTIRARYLAWSAGHPSESAALQAALADSVWPLYLPGIYDRLEECAYVDEVVYPDPNVTMHELADRVTGAVVYAVWTHSGTATLIPSYAGRHRVTRGNGTVIDLPADLITVQTEPVLLEVLETTGTSDLPDIVRPGPVLAVSPSPFRSRTTIAFDLAAECPVRVAVFSPDGRRVRDLTMSRMGPGVHRVLWDGTDDRGRRVAAGVYSVVLRAGSETAGARVVLLR